ncbi:MAG: hypothetical protein KY464_18165 [Gemmatimonadetes bacterium]|nr:hypothetical protein [Gemmatimonadota bacterium]
MSLLLTVTGRDHPGVTAALFDVLADHGAVPTAMPAGELGS